MASRSASRTSLTSLWPESSTTSAWSTRSAPAGKARRSDNHSWPERSRYSSNSALRRLRDHLIQGVVENRSALAFTGERQDCLQPGGIEILGIDGPLRARGHLYDGHALDIEFEPQTIRRRHGHTEGRFGVLRELLHPPEG